MIYRTGVAESQITKIHVYISRKTLWENTHT